MTTPPTVSDALREALANLCRVIDLHDSETLSLNRPDRFVVLVGSNSWTGEEAALTLGDLRALAAWAKLRKAEESS
jgi:hypothetical protein